MKPLWTPSPERIERARLTRFMRHLARTEGATFTSYDPLYLFSVSEPETFWRAVWDFCGIIGEPGDRVAIDMDRMPGARFFPDASLNFAENVLRQRGPGPALIFNGENRTRRIVTHDELRESVGRFAAALRAASGPVCRRTPAKSRPSRVCMKRRVGASSGIDGEARPCMRCGCTAATGGAVPLVALTPIALFHFHKAGLYGALANVVNVPLMMRLS